MDTRGDDVRGRKKWKEKSCWKGTGVRDRERCEKRGRRRRRRW